MRRLLAVLLLTTVRLHAGSPSVVGKWSEKITWPNVGVHVILLPDGRLLSIDRNEDGPPPHHGTRAFVGGPEMKNPTPLQVCEFNIFCAGHAFLPDGTVLLAGGHTDSNEGIKTTFLFDARFTTFKRQANMNKGRWYPTVITLRNGDLLVLGGTDEHKGINEVPQVWETKTKKWRNLTARVKFESFSESYYYPMLFIAPKGSVFMAGPGQHTFFINTEGDGSVKQGSNTLGGDRQAGSAVQYEPGKIALIGGGWEPKNLTETIDLNEKDPVWKKGVPMKNARRQMNATLLADGTVLATGGTSRGSKENWNDATGAVYEAELWKPGFEGGKWTTMAPMREARLYHSTAILLPDARVLVAGGGQPPGNGRAPGNDKADENHETAQIFSPPYLFEGDHDATRPVIKKAPESVKFGESFVVKTDDAASISR
ncbi:MAG: galactose oxidase-like domain-containing protein, partial [Thermoanaerobaculia bacterium]